MKGQESLLSESIQGLTAPFELFRSSGEQGRHGAKQTSSRQ